MSEEREAAGEAREADRARILGEFQADPWLAHTTLFGNSLLHDSGECHVRIVAAIHTDNPRAQVEGFRGVGKSTLLEQTAIIRAGFRKFRNMVVLGASYTRAADRLATIKNEIQNNEMVALAFGNLRGKVWQEGKIVLSSGACIQALGRDQQMLGIKYLDARPDAALVDDVEDPDEIRSDAEREQTWRWFIKTFLPALDHPLYTWVRALGTRRGVGSLPERLEKDGWPTLKVPIEYLDGKAARRATWPAKFPLTAIDRMKTTYRGDAATWNEEYMCQADRDRDRLFTRAMFVYRARERGWAAVYAMTDPARTTNRDSATTGWAVWSWFGPVLHVWWSGAARLKPDEIVELQFEIARRFNPVWLRVEEDGLNEWLHQPMRREQVRRGVTLPYRGQRAPRGKDQFIGSLQPFFAAREVTFDGPQPELEDQLLSFPTGDKDAPNALAFAVLTRPAAPIYDISDDNVAEIEPASAPLYLAGNATGSLVTAALVQYVEGRLLILADWVREGAPFEIAGEIHREAALLGETSYSRAAPPAANWIEGLKTEYRPPIVERRRPQWVIPAQHRERYMNVGLEQAIRSIPSACGLGGDVLLGRDWLRGALSRRASGRPLLLISPNSGWTLRAMAGGYTRMVGRDGVLSENAEEGVYRMLMEGVESLAAILCARGEEQASDDAQPLAYNRWGVAYKSAMPQRR